MFSSINGWLIEGEPISRRETDVNTASQPNRDTPPAPECAVQHRDLERQRPYRFTPGKPHTRFKEGINGWLIEGAPISRRETDVNTASQPNRDTPPAPECAVQHRDLERQRPYRFTPGKPHTRSLLGGISHIKSPVKKFRHCRKGRKRAVGRRVCKSLKPAYMTIDAEGSLLGGISHIKSPVKKFRHCRKGRKRAVGRRVCKSLKPAYMTIDAEGGLRDMSHGPTAPLKKQLAKTISEHRAQSNRPRSIIEPSTSVRHNYRFVSSLGRKKVPMDKNLPRICNDNTVRRGISYKNPMASIKRRKKSARHKRRNMKIVWDQESSNLLKRGKAGSKTVTPVKISKKLYGQIQPLGTAKLFGESIDWPSWKAIENAQNMRNQDSMDIDKGPQSSSSFMFGKAKTLEENQSQKMHFLQNTGFEDLDELKALPKVRDRRNKEQVVLRNIMEGRKTNDMFVTHKLGSSNLRKQERLSQMKRVRKRNQYKVENAKRMKPVKKNNNVERIRVICDTSTPTPLLNTYPPHEKNESTEVNYALHPVAAQITEPSTLQYQLTKNEQDGSGENCDKLCHGDSNKTHLCDNNRHMDLGDDVKFKFEILVNPSSGFEELIARKPATSSHNLISNKFTDELKNCAHRYRCVIKCFPIDEETTNQSVKPDSVSVR
ncbi:hypothetical protein AAG570_005180 [Ranatra chinensis]|uniref:Uncharacterized protein n=1 Tax=Ranatra chinensis TaxID=642074 RepID=A0ABD0Y008_9HEMI